jgi:hypothetical protein
MVSAVAQHHLLQSSLLLPQNKAFAVLVDLDDIPSKKDRNDVTRHSITHDFSKGSSGASNWCTDCCQDGQTSIPPIDAVMCQPNLPEAGTESIACTQKSLHKHQGKTRIIVCIAKKKVNFICHKVASNNASLDLSKTKNDNSGRGFGSCRCVGGNDTQADVGPC